MSLFEEIKRFVSKWIKNPIVLMAVGYIIYKTLQNYIKKESVTKLENIKVLQRNGNQEVIFDTRTKMYVLIDGTDIIETSNKEIKI